MSRQELEKQGAFLWEMCVLNAERDHRLPFLLHFEVRHEAGHKVTHQGVVKFLQPEKPFELKELNALVGGRIELLGLPMGYWMVVNEDGIHLRLEHNRLADWFFSASAGCKPEDLIGFRGDVLVVPKRQLT